ncbi:peptidase M56 BlaR1 [Caldicellulosiruptor hydrothermalis 108]|uniref:Peptidase M56 BlaR1 n=1 Tax=Caldicellulosiruptor hydrothermalis (strain DSM 18901 / VKM B-2411 / 108) TaxID=632292 RepID=E4QAB4_CALH1|nr:M56 family metallopeptidase [Caldicellulosiruptor hydrothermalis]ADQ07086.1 peptidase M56 BlaR1 [Caldicellulosiruptor hydrothermalis 108]
MNIEVIFKWILVMTVGGSIAVLIFAILSKIFKEHLSARARYYIWMIGLFCFTIPWNVLIKFCKKDSRVLNQSIILGNSSHITSKLSNTSSLNLQLTENTAQGGALTALPSENIGYFNLEVLRKVIVYVWLIGAIIFFAWFLMRYIWFKLILVRNSRECSNEYCKRIIERYCRLKRISRKIKVLENDIIPTPMLIGTITPILLIPAKAIVREDLRLIIRHELVHFKRKDVLVKWLSKLINALHWFNPLVYFAVLKLNRECEYSCDEEVIRKLKKDGKRKYAEVLYNTLLVSIGSGAGAAFGLVGRKESIVERFRFIMSLEARKMSKGAKVFAVVLVLTTIFLSAFVQIWAKDILSFESSEIEAIKSTIEGFYETQYKAYLQMEYIDITPYLDMSKIQNQNKVIALKELVFRRKYTDEKKYCYVEKRHFPYELHYKNIELDGNKAKVVIDLEIKLKEAYPSFISYGENIFELEKQDGTWKITKHIYDKWALMFYEFSTDQKLPEPDYEQIKKQIDKDFGVK